MFARTITTLMVVASSVGCAFAQNITGEPKCKLAAPTHKKVFHASYSSTSGLGATVTVKGEVTVKFTGKPNTLHYVRITGSLGAGAVSSNVPPERAGVTASFVLPVPPPAGTPTNMVNWIEATTNENGIFMTTIPARDIAMMLHPAAYQGTMVVSQAVTDNLGLWSVDPTYIKTNGWRYSNGFLVTPGAHYPETYYQTLTNQVPEEVIDKSTDPPVT